jgi:CheY-like chemotaxis protein
MGFLGFVLESAKWRDSFANAASSAVVNLIQMGLSCCRSHSGQIRPASPRIEGQSDKVDGMPWPLWRALAVVWPYATATRILVVDDHDAVRREFCALLQAQPDLDVVCDAANGEEAVRRAAELQPDVVLLDISLPGLDGFTTARLIREGAPSAEILFVSQHDTLQMVREALRAGGRGYVVKLDAIDELVAAVRSVSQKRQFISARLAAYL